MLQTTVFIIHVYETDVQLEETHEISWLGSPLKQSNNKYKKVQNTNFECR